MLLEEPRRRRLLIPTPAQSRAERVTCSALTNGLTDTQYDALDAPLNQNLEICKRDPKTGAFLVGIPLEIGFVLVIPLVYIVSKRVGISLIKVGIPLLADLSVVHGLVPPHPGPLLAIGIFGADIDKTIFYGLLVGLPTAMISGPIFGNFISKTWRSPKPSRRGRLWRLSSRWWGSSSL